MTPLGMTKKRGGQRSHWAEAARVWAWYNDIKQRCNWTDYKLDNEFAWTDAGKAVFSSADRPRTFEWIRREARKPSGRDERWRSMAELVEAVEQHPQFQGARDLYVAEIWTFLQESTMTPQLLKERLDRIIHANDLVRIPFDKLPQKFGLMIIKFGKTSLFARCLRTSLKELDLTSQIELVWLLYQQTEPSHNSQFRCRIEVIADKLLDDFFSECLPEYHSEFYPDAIECLLHNRLDMSADMGYGHLEVEGTWPVLPRSQVDMVDEISLFGENIDWGMLDR